MHFAHSCIHTVCLYINVVSNAYMLVNACKFARIYIKSIPILKEVFTSTDLWSLFTNETHNLEKGGGTTKAKNKLCGPYCCANVTHTQKWVEMKKKSKILLTKIPVWWTASFRFTRRVPLGRFRVPTCWLYFWWNGELGFFRLFIVTLCCCPYVIAICCRCPKRCCVINWASHRKSWSCRVASSGWGDGFCATRAPATGSCRRSELHDPCPAECPQRYHWTPKQIKS